MPYSGMNASHARLAIASSLALLATGCDLTVGPGAFAPRDLALDFCSNETPVWFTYQNQGGDWVRVTPDAAGTFRFTASYRVVLVYVRQSGSDYHTEIIGATSPELAQISGTTCLEENGTKQVNGSVTGISGSQRAQVSMMFASPYLQLPQTSFTLQNLPDRSLDLVASRVTFTGTTTQASDPIIIRRNQNFVTGETMPVLDFASAEAVTPTTNTVTVAGIEAGETAGLGNDFFSAQGTPHVLFFATLSANGNVSVPSVPASQTVAGEYNDMFMFGSVADGRFRGAETFFRTPSDKTFGLAAQITAVPTFTAVSTTPYLRHRVQMAITPDYQSAVSFFLHQQFQQISVTDITLTVTQRYYTSSTAEWNLTIPDLSAVEGWLNAWGLQDGTPFTWRATIYRGRAALLFGAAPEEDEAILFAGRSSSPAPPALQALRARGDAFTAPRSRPASPAP